jgi:FkbM family methyltransferase
MLPDGIAIPSFGRPASRALIGSLVRTKNEQLRSNFESRDLTIDRLVKYLTAAIKPAFWPALTRGVMPAVEHIDAIKGLNPKTLIDIGANKGQFSLVARYLFPEIEIHAFEPLEHERNLLVSVVSEPITIYKTALGELQGEATFFVTSRADSSSLLKPGAGQSAAYGVALSSTISVPVARLVDVIDVRHLPRPILMKADVQGGELAVFKGAKGLLSSVEAVYCEVSFVPLYELQPLAHELISYLAEEGLFLRGVFNQSTTTQFGPTQADLLFVRARQV